MTIIESLRKYIKSCPYLKEGLVRVDFLGADPIEYVIESVPTSAVIKKYADGGCLKEYIFIFGSREWYGSQIRQNIENSGFYEDFAKWVETQNESGILPELSDEKVAQRIEVLSTGYLYYGDTDNARYQIQCRLVYYEGGNKYGTN